MYIRETAIDGTRSSKYNIDVEEKNRSVFALQAGGQKLQIVFREDVGHQIQLTRASEESFCLECGLWRQRR